MSSVEAVGRWLLTFVFASSLVIRVADGQTASRDSRADVLTIVNSAHADVPRDRAKVLLLTTCRVVAEEFHRKPEEVELQMTLIVGAGSERYAIDPAGHMTLYLESWNEVKFVDGVITGAMQRLTPLRTRRQMLSEILRRTDRIAPVGANQLRGPQPVRPANPGALPPDCINATMETPCPWPNRVPF
jgi:hypothetical protein